MPCYHPKPGWRVNKTLPNGHTLKEPCLRPCGGCIGCRLDKSLQWGIRCCHESESHKQNIFITLTYRNEDLPENKSISKDELQRFFKRLRKDIAYKGSMPLFDKAMRIQYYVKPSHPKFGKPKTQPVYRDIKYYSCGEYGDKLGRPHYHAIIFGYDFPDKKLLHKGRVTYWQQAFNQSNDCDLYTSERLEKIWKKGYVTIGEVTLESAMYVARYTMKKIYGKPAKDHYRDKEPEFALMSKGIGKEWFKKFKTDCFPKDFLMFKGKRVNIPRYYEKMMEKYNPKMVERVKERRKQFSDPEKQREYPRMEKHKSIITKQLNRRIH